MSGLRRFPLPLIAAFFALYVIWGSTYLVIRIGVEYWPPLLLAGIRFVIAGTLMYAFLRWRGAPAPTWAQWKAAGIIGILLLACGNGGVSVAEAVDRDAAERVQIAFAGSVEQPGAFTALETDGQASIGIHQRRLRHN